MCICFYNKYIKINTQYKIYEYIKRRNDLDFIYLFSQGHLFVSRKDVPFLYLVCILMKKMFPFLLGPLKDIGFIARLSTRAKSLYPVRRSSVQFHVVQSTVLNVLNSLSDVNHSRTELFSGQVSRFSSSSVSGQEWMKGHMLTLIIMYYLLPLWICSRIQIWRWISIIQLFIVWESKQKWEFQFQNVLNFSGFMFSAAKTNWFVQTMIVLIPGEIWIVFLLVSYFLFIMLLMVFKTL